MSLCNHEIVDLGHKKQIPRLRAPRRLQGPGQLWRAGLVSRTELIKPRELIAYSRHSGAVLVNQAVLVKKMNNCIIMWH